MDQIKRLRLICGILAIICFAIAGIRLAEMILFIVDPSLLGSNLQCLRSGCHFVADRLQLLGPITAVEARNIHGIEQAIADQVAQAAAQRFLAAATLAQYLPLVALYAALGFTMLRLRDAERFNLRAIIWLRRTALISAIAVIAKPVAENLQSWALRPVYDMLGGWHFSIIGSELVTDLLLAGIVWVAAWALSEGRRVNDELSEYI